MNRLRILVSSLFTLLVVTSVAVVNCFFFPIRQKQRNRLVSVVNAVKLSANTVIDKDNNNDDGANNKINTDCFSITANSSSNRRRNFLTQTVASTTAAILSSSVVSSLPLPVLSVEEGTPVEEKVIEFGASWSAVDGLNQMNDSNAQNKVVGFDMNAYKAMRDDTTRTPLFETAIKKRLELSGQDNNQIVIDLGTGPFALFAIIAARYGAKKVYAIEANAVAAKSARESVKKAGYDNVIEIVDGYSTQVELQEKVDFMIAEIIGSIASEEGVYATIKDAQRFLKDPTNPNNWIPNRIQTFGAPASYTLHNLFGPPEFDWTRLNGEPVRFSCRDNGLQLLSDPQLIEDISFFLLGKSHTNTTNIEEQSLSFTVNKERIEQNMKPLFDELQKAKGNDKQFSEKMAQETAHSFTGIAMWPRLFLNDDIVIDSRFYPTGGHQKSHWQTVLPIMSGRPIANLVGGELIKIKSKFELPGDVTKAPQYSIQGELKYT